MADLESTLSSDGEQVRFGVLHRLADIDNFRQVAYSPYNISIPPIILLNY